jgi:hypothetical protein
MRFPSITSAALIGAQALVALGGLVALRLQPPAQGEMLLVPLGDQAQSELVTFAHARGFSMIAAGDWPGSMVVRGERDRLGWALRDEGLLVIASEFKGCSPA